MIDKIYLLSLISCDRDLFPDFSLLHDEQGAVAATGFQATGDESRQMQAVIEMCLDFFSISAQNKALAITANCCQGLLLEEYPLVVDALPVLSSRLIHDDKNLVDTSFLLWTQWAWRDRAAPRIRRL